MDEPAFSQRKGEVASVGSVVSRVAVRIEPETGASAQSKPVTPLCPICNGFGYVRRDLRVGDPHFGKYDPCECRRSKTSSRLQKKAYSYCNMAVLQGMTFDNFIRHGRPGIPQSQSQSIESAFDLVKACADDIQTLQRSLILSGGVGSGKTHLAAALTNSLIDKGVPVLFFTVPDLLDLLRSLFNGGQHQDQSFEQTFEAVKTAPVLVLDDYGSEKNSEWVSEKMYQLINFRYMTRLPTIVTINVSLDTIDDRIRSRLLDSETALEINIDAPDYRSAPLAASTAGTRSVLGTFPAAGDFTFDRIDDRTKGKWQIPETDMRFTFLQTIDRIKTFAENPRLWVLVAGSTHVGKSHLLAACVDQMVSSGRTVLCGSLPDMIDFLRDAFAEQEGVVSSEFTRRMNMIKRADVLVIDDFSTRTFTAWANERLFQILNFRYNEKLPTLIASTERTSDMDPRIRSRFLNQDLCQYFEVDAPPYGVRKK